MTAFDYDMKFINQVAKEIPDKATSIDDALKISPSLSWKIGRLKKELKVMRDIEGTVSTQSKHAAGVVIAPEDITNYAPVHIDRDTNMPILDLDKYMCEKPCGLIKHDLLGLKTLTVIRRTLARVKKKYGKDINIWEVDKKDKKVYDFINGLDLLGVFQLEGDSARDVVEKVKPDTFEDIIAINAISRPGVKEAQMFINNRVKVNSYINLQLKKGIARDDIDISPALPRVHPIVDEILDETYGAIVYQEQTMLLMNKMTGGRWSLGFAEKLRKVDDLEEYREDFIEQCRQNGLSSDLSNKVFDRFSLEYSFNKSHSVAYAYTIFATAYLKRYYRVEFMTEILNKDKSDPKKKLNYILENKKAKINMLPPNINAQSTDFDEEDGNIIYGLLGIKNVGETALENIVEVSKEKEITSLKDLYDRAYRRVLNKRVVEGLIKSGVFDFENPNRTEMLNEYYKLRGSKDRVEVLESKELDKQHMEWEKEYLGFYLTSHPLDEFYFKSYNDIGNSGLIGGIITNVKQITTKKNDEMAFVALETLDGMKDCVVFPKTYKKYKQWLKVDNVVMTRGRKENEEKWISDTFEVLKKL